MKLLAFCSLVFPAFLAASPVSCPTASYADLLTLSSCTVSIYTLSDFTFSSSALNAQSTVTLVDSGTAGSGIPFNPEGSDSTVRNDAVVTTVGPDKIQFFTINISDLSGLTAPEPATSLMFGMGLLAVTYAGRKLRKRA